MIERDEDTFDALKEMAEDIHLISRNHNDELIGIEYYNNLSVLSDDELSQLELLWHLKCITCHKEKLASQWMVVQVFILISVAIYIAWISGGIAGAVFSIMATTPMILKTAPAIPPEIQAMYIATEIKINTCTTIHWEASFSLWQVIHFRCQSSSS